MPRGYGPYSTEGSIMESWLWLLCRKHGMWFLTWLYVGEYVSVSLQKTNQIVLLSICGKFSLFKNPAYWWRNSTLVTYMIQASFSSVLLVVTGPETLSLIYMNLCLLALMIWKFWFSLHIPSQKFQTSLLTFGKTSVFHNVCWHSLLQIKVLGKRYLKLFIYF